MREKMLAPSLWMDFFPKFNGATHMAVSNEVADGEDNHYIILEDLTSGYARPCICDLKIGYRGIPLCACEKKRHIFSCKSLM